MHKFTLTPSKVALGLLLLTAVVTTLPLYAQSTDVDSILQEDIASSITVVAMRGDDVVTQSEDGEAVELNIVNYVGLDIASQPTDDTRLVVSGENTPTDAKVSVRLQNSEVVENPTVENEGSWSATIPVSKFEPGMEQVEVQIQHNGVISKNVVVAEVEVRATEALSQATWVYVISTCLAIVCLLLAITVQLRHNTKMLSPV